MVDRHAHCFRSIQHRISSWMDHSSCRQGCPLHDKTNFRSYLHSISSWMDPAATLLANPVNPMLCTTKIGLITQSSQLYNIPLDGKTNFGSVQHRISSWMSHLCCSQGCPLHGKTNFRSIQHRISSWMDHLSYR